jgi:hypothetical protein
MTEVRKCNAEARVVFRMTEVRFGSVGTRFLWNAARTFCGPLITRLICHGLINQIKAVIVTYKSFQQRNTSTKKSEKYMYRATSYLGNLPAVHVSVHTHPGLCNFGVRVQSARRVGVRFSLFSQYVLLVRVPPLLDRILEPLLVVFLS